MPQVQVPIVSGIYATTAPDLRTAYPLNLYPCPKESGISAGYLKPGDGLVAFTTGPGIDRGGSIFGAYMYRVMGSKLCRVEANGTVTQIGDVGTDLQPVTMSYGFDYLGIASDGDLWLMNGSETLAQVTDPDLGTVIDFVWIDGYYMFTDGEFIGVTELNDPFSVNPIKYASSEADPDPVKALLRIRNEAYAINRYTIEVFDNVGGSGFPFQRIEGAQIEKGACGTQSCCVFAEMIAFLGSGQNEQNSVYLGFNGATQKISTQEIDMQIMEYTEAQLEASVLEQRNYGSHWFLYCHFPNKTLVYDHGASQELGSPVWFVLSSEEIGTGIYRARFWVWCYNKWIFADTNTPRLGTVDYSISSHWGDTVRWEFSTPIVYNESNGVIFNRLELVALTGSYVLGEAPTVTTSYTLDGVNWADDRAVTLQAGTLGNRSKRLAWFQQGYMENWRIQRFTGTSEAHISFIRLEAHLEPLAW